METVADFIFLGSKSTADGDFNDEIKRCLLLGRKAMINLDSILNFPGDTDGKESACNAGEQSSIPGSGPSPGGAHGNPLPYSCLENTHEQSSLAGYNPLGFKESEITE